MGLLPGVRDRIPRMKNQERETQNQEAMKERSPESAGILYALGAYGLWGVLPIYWKNIEEISAKEILSHRIALYRALGGTWTEQLSRSPTDTEKTIQGESS